MPQTGIIKPFDPKDPTKELKELNWEATVVDPSKSIPLPVSILNRGDNEFCHLGDIQAIEGHSGSKKTYLMTGMAAPLISEIGDEYLKFGCMSDHPDNRVLIIDTEQALGSTQIVQHRILKMAGLDENKPCQRLKVVNLREYTPEERMEIVKQAVISYKPNVMFIDNIKDLVNDFNDIEESQRIVGEVMKMSSGYYTKNDKGEPMQMAIICVIHQNFSSDKARGHLGSLIYEKASLVISLKTKENDRNTYVTYSKVRNARPEDFSFYIDPASKLPVLAEDKTPGMNNEVLQNMFAKALESPLGHNELVRKLMGQEGKSERSCKYYINSAAAAGIIIKKENQYEINASNVLPF